jgi:hypothetical protein
MRQNPNTKKVPTIEMINSTSIKSEDSKEVPVAVTSIKNKFYIKNEKGRNAKAQESRAKTLISFKIISIKTLQ